MSTPCQSGQHHWTDPKDAAKCCHPHWQRTLVPNGGENAQLCENVLLGREWTYVGPLEALPLLTPQETQDLEDVLAFFRRANYPDTKEGNAAAGLCHLLLRAKTFYEQ